MKLEQSHYYSNGAYGRSWGVRRIASIVRDPESNQNWVHYESVAGTARGQTGDLPIDEFLRWARYEVRLVENDWKRVDAPDP